MELKRSGTPLISIVVTTYNCASTINYVLESLLNQDYDLRLIEIMVIDDCSEDNTISMIYSFMEKYKALFYDFKIIVHEKNLGVSKARNDGIMRSKGKYILILDCDVILPPDGISKLVEFMEKNPEVGCSQILLRHVTHGPIAKWNYEVHKNKIRAVNYCTAAAMIRRDVIYKAGLYDETLGPPFSVDEDIEFGARIWKSGFKCLQLGMILGTHLAEERDRYLALLREKKVKHKKIPYTLAYGLVKQFLGYLKRKQGISWFKFLSSLPIRGRLRIIFHSTFAGLLIIVVIGFITTRTVFLIPTISILLAIYVDVLREFINFRKVHRSMLLAMLACFNRSIRTTSAFLWFTVTSIQRCVEERFKVR